MKPSETARIGPSRIVDDVAVDTALIKFSDSLDSRSSPLPQDSWLKIESKTFGFQRSLICTKSRFDTESYQGNPEGEIVLFLFNLLVCYICLLIFRGAVHYKALYVEALPHGSTLYYFVYNFAEKLPLSCTFDLKKKRTLFTYLLKNIASLGMKLMNNITRAHQA